MEVGELRSVRLERAGDRGEPYGQPYRRPALVERVRHLARPGNLSAWADQVRVRRSRHEEAVAHQRPRWKGRTGFRAAGAESGRPQPRRLQDPLPAASRTLQRVPRGRLRRETPRQRRLRRRRTHGLPAVTRMQRLAKNPLKMVLSPNLICQSSRIILFGISHEYDDGRR